MGLSDLRELAHIESIDYETVAGSVVAVDFHNWVYRYITILARYQDPATYTTSDGTEVPNLPGIVKGLPKFYEHQLYPVFVFDGTFHELKADEMARRRERKEDADEAMAEAEEAGDVARARRLRARTQRLTPTMLETSRELLERLDVPVVEAPAEAEAQAAHMAATSSVDSVGTEDYDALLFGAPVTLRKLTSSGDIERMDLERTLEEHGITRAQLVDIAVLCGTDYNDGVAGVGPKTALSAVQAGRTAEDVLAERGAEIPDLDEIRSIFLDPSVTDDFAVRHPRDVDLSGAHAYLVEEWEIPADVVETAFERLDATLPWVPRAG